LQASRRAKNRGAIRKEKDYRDAYHEETVGAEVLLRRS
jgi:hypothetical protein